MIPWPIALLCVFYAVIATVSAASLWQGLARPSTLLAWPVAWLVLTTVVTVGLGLMKPWARRVAVWTSLALMVAALCAAWMAAILTPPSARASLLGTGLASIQFVVIRYLTRPHVKAWFACQTQPG